MPNWCSNVLEVSGPSKQLAAFAEAVTATDGSEPFSLEALLPEPDLSGFERDGWYEWRVQHWGTKWDVGDVELESGDGRISYQFESAWSPPSAAVRVAAAMHPGLRLALSFGEGGNDFAGHEVFEGGELVRSFGGEMSSIMTLTHEDGTESCDECSDDSDPYCDDAYFELRAPLAEAVLELPEAKLGPLRAALLSGELPLPAVPLPDLRIVDEVLVAQQADLGSAWELATQAGSYGQRGVLLQGFARGSLPVPALIGRLLCRVGTVADEPTLEVLRLALERAIAAELGAEWVSAFETLLEGWSGELGELAEVSWALLAEGR